MQKFLKYFALGTGAGIGLIYAFGYQFIFKAIGINLKKGPFTPSIDDGENFGYHPVPNGEIQPWEKHTAYNTLLLPPEVINNLEESKASALLVIKEGKLMHEQYWNEHNQYSLMNSFSMAKAILNMLVGAAIDDGYIKSENQLFSDFYPDFADDENGRHLRLKHLMLMQAGLKWVEAYNHPFAPNAKQYYVEDLAEQVFSRKVKEMPGKNYEYQSAAPQLLAFALRKAVQRPLAAYLSEKLWLPLGMESPARWSIDSKGMEKAFCCLHAIARDFAKIGYLLMHDGAYNGRQLISANYIRKMKVPSKPNDAFGYTVWINKDCGIEHYFLYGFLGQFIIMIPDRQLVIVKTGHLHDLPVDAKLRPEQVNFLTEQICKIC